MKRILFITLLVPLSFIASFSNAFAEAIPYISAKLGYTYHLPTSIQTSEPDISIKHTGGNTAILGGAVGIIGQITPRFAIRSELEYAYRFNSKQNLNIPEISAELTAQTVLLNIYFDYSIIPNLNLYVSGGVGLSILEYNFPSSGQPLLKTPTKLAFGAQAGAGVQYTFFNHLILDFNLRYLYLGKWKYANHQDSINATLSAVEAIVSIGYKF